MATERIIGIDFGTSTSVMRVKQYENGRPVGDRLMTQPVTFDGGSTMTPTLIRKAGETYYFGHDAETNKKNSELFMNFKMKLGSADAEEKRQAQELVERYLMYLAGRYRALDESNVFGSQAKQVKTLISYPVKWAADTKLFMLEAARKAGFANVEGIDEAQAAIQAIAVQNADTVRTKKAEGNKVTVLMMDMGAGTTDLVLCTYDLRTNKTDMICTWPKDGDVTYGGRELDERLVQYIKGVLPEEQAALILKKCGKERFKKWKETIVSPTLASNGRVDEFPDLDSILDLLGIEEVDYSFGRSEFETIMGDYLKQLPELVTGCLNEGQISGADVDFVILTGGHSQWYFVRDILPDGATGLGKIAMDRTRIISLALPQETVAAGLAYSNMPELENCSLEYHEKIPATCMKKGRCDYWQDTKTGKKFVDENGTRELGENDLELPKAPHNYTWEIEKGNRVCKCLTCGTVKHEREAEPVTKPATGSKSAPEQETAPVMKAATDPQITPEQDPVAPDTEFDIKPGDDPNTCLIVNYNGCRSRLIIPETIQGRKVIGINPVAFNSLGIHAPRTGNLQYVVIPKTVERIGADAFANCSSLDTVIVSGSLREIDDHAFRNCRNLKSIIVSGNLEGIGMEAFQSCNKLTTFRFAEFYEENNVPGVVYFPKTLKHISFNAFIGSSIKKIFVSRDTYVHPVGIGIDISIHQYEEDEISAANEPKKQQETDQADQRPNGNRIAGGPFGNGFNWAFYDDNTLYIEGSGEMPDFEYQSKFHFFSDTEEWVLSPWFRFHDQIHRVIIGNGITSIGDHAFHLCGGLERAVIPEGIKKIGDWAFGKTRLKAISLPDTLQSIGWLAFYRTNIADIVIPDSVSVIGAGAFSGCKKLWNVVLSNSLISIEGDTFRECASLKSIIIPRSVRTIDDKAFWLCYLDEIRIPYTTKFTYHGNAKIINYD